MPNVKALLEEYEVSYEDMGGGELRVSCPFHDEEDPSCFVNEDKAVFRCFGCNSKGDVFTLLAGAMKTTRKVIVAHANKTGAGGGIPQDAVYTAHGDLLRNSSALKTLEERQGLNKDTVIKYLIGFDGTRFTIPIFDQNENVLNIRKWSAKSKQYKMINEKGFGERRLYPIRAAESDPIIIAEGEFKALLLNQLGFNAIAPTGGASTWSHDWNNLFKDKQVYIMYDIDQAGINGAKRVAKEIYDLATSVKIVDLPIDPKKIPNGDITDYIIELGHTATDIQQLLNEATEWKPEEVQQLEDEFAEDDDPIEISLQKTSRAEYYLKLVSCEVVVSAKDTAPYLIPQSFAVTCDKGSKDCCGYCPINLMKGKSEIVIKDRHPILLELIGISTEALHKVLRKAARIPALCPGAALKITKTVNIEEVRLIPQIQIGSPDDEYVVRRAFYIGGELETNITYKIKARVVPEPKTQYATLLMYDAEASLDSLACFELTPRMKKELDIFKPDDWTEDAINRKLDQLYLDLEANVTRIYQRGSLHLFYDLIYHSVLYLPFQGRRIKGWAEGLVLGDSGQGKSECVSRLKDHYGLGEKIDAKGASVAGLIGGLQEVSKRWFVTWGVITLNDQRLVILEEVKGLSTEIIGKLTETRSSGIAEVSKVEKARTNARTRLLWISNPRTDKKLLAYNYGVEAVKELIGSLEDIRRFDMAILVASGEVSKSMINISDADRPKSDHTHTSELCKNLILWGWSRKIDQIKFEDDAVTEILETASQMGATYVSNIPLVEAADQRLKIARLASALAVRTFSTDKDGVTLIIRRCHVEFVSKFLNAIYSNDVMGYYDYSRMIKSETELRDSDEIISKLKELPYAKDVVKSMLESATFTHFDLSDWTDMSLDQTRVIMGIFVRKNAVKKARRGYSKTPAFIALLKMLDRSDELTNEGMEEDDEI